MQAQLALLAQARPGGKILLTLSGWLYGYARALLEGSPVKLWERIEHALDAYDAAGAPGPETFTLHVYGVCESGDLA
jgi:hypothetical protein